MSDFNWDMIKNLNWEAAWVFLGFFALVTVLGFAASAWKKGDGSGHELEDWGLGGRSFGAFISWFLIGGDLYTAYTVVAVPALVFAVGAYGFFAVPYTIIIYPLMFLILPRLWTVTHRKGYITGADFVMGRYGNRWLELAVAFTGLLATMPYIALQLVGIEKVIEALGFNGQGLAAHLPITLAFIILALYTYKAGLRAPAMIAFVKDIMIYVFVIAAVIIIPMKLGGYGAIFDKASAGYTAKKASLLLATDADVTKYITVAIGSALALFMYPHMITGVLSSSSPKAIKRNAIALPAYTLVLGLIALLGVMAVAAGIHIDKAQYGIDPTAVKEGTQVVPKLFLLYFPDWFSGFCFAAIAIGALVPAAVMSIGASNTFTRNVWKPFVNPQMDGAEETFIAKIVSLVVKIGALVVIFEMDTQFAIDFQLLGGLWMVQCFPAIVFGLYTRWFSGWGLLAGWAVGMSFGTWLAMTPTVTDKGEHVLKWFPAVDPSVKLGFMKTIVSYNGISALVLNIVISVVISAVVAIISRTKAADETVPEDYKAYKAA